MAKKTKKTTKKKATSAAKSISWPQMHTRVSAQNQKFLHAVKRATGKDVIVVLDQVLSSARKSGVKSVAKFFGSSPATKKVEASGAEA